MPKLQILLGLFCHLRSTPGPSTTKYEPFVCSAYLGATGIHYFDGYRNTRLAVHGFLDLLVVRHRDAEGKGRAENGGSEFLRVRPHDNRW